MFHFTDVLYYSSVFSTHEATHGTEDLKHS